MAMYRSQIIFMILSLNSDMIMMVVVCDIKGSNIKTKEEAIDKIICFNSKIVLLVVFKLPVFQ